ncbi:hypothetical protein CYMTET_37376 [Cymbomonas tetramitiformis]|uniref:Uncharacterized protein n=1 Tax=Cymbomonas tetramitiformis TaxID=36881 RepID=A0AAE0CGF9_9CHLO|nr:hypothetical protein CYMTET_37376 [Cymbomonas tetramitiformis]
MRCENDENLLSLAMKTENDDSTLWETLLENYEDAREEKFDALCQMCTSGNVRAELVRLLIDHIVRCRERMSRDEYRRGRTDLLPLHEVARVGTLTMARDMLMVDAELCEDMAVMREDDPELYTPMQQVAMLANQTKTDEDATMIPLHAGGGEGGGGGGGDGEGGGGDGEGGGGDGEGGGGDGEEAMVKEKVERVAMVKEGEAMARGDAAMREEAMVTTAVEEFECTKRWCLRFARM